MATLQSSLREAMAYGNGVFDAMIKNREFSILEKVIYYKNRKISFTKLNLPTFNPNFNFSPRTGLLDILWLLHFAKQKGGLVNMEVKTWNILFYFSQFLFIKT